MLTLDERRFIANDIVHYLKEKLNLQGSAHHFINMIGPIPDALLCSKKVSDVADPLQQQFNALRDELTRATDQFWAYRRDVNVLGVFRSVELAGNIYIIQRIKYLQYILLSVYMFLQEEDHSHFFKTNIAGITGLVLYALLRNAYTDSCTLVSFKRLQKSYDDVVVILGVQHKEMNLYAYNMPDDEWSKLIADNPNAVVIDFCHSQGFYSLSDIHQWRFDDTREEMGTTKAHIDLHLQNLFDLKMECIHEHPEIVELLEKIDRLIDMRLFQKTSQSHFFKVEKNEQGCEPPPGSYISPRNGKTMIC